jgi:hypothetical protein
LERYQEREMWLFGAFTKYKARRSMSIQAFGRSYGGGKRKYIIPVCGYRDSIYLVMGRVCKFRYYSVLFL